LSKYEVLSGTLRSTGHYQGTVARLNVDADASIPAFEIDGTGHRIPVKAIVHARVNGQR
jgi:hypothetical protein